MEIITAEAVINAAWDQMFRGSVIPDSCSSNLALHFNVEINIENFGYERDGKTHHPEWERNFYRSLEFVATARHEVFLRKRDCNVPPAKEKFDPRDWENTSNHDSCWRTDGLRPIWETLAEGHNHCWAHIPPHHQKSMNEMQRHCSVNTGPFSRGLIQLVRVTTDADPNRSRSRSLTAMKKVDFTLALVDHS